MIAIYWTISLWIVAGLGWWAGHGAGYFKGFAAGAKAMYDDLDAPDPVRRAARDDPRGEADR